MRTANPALNDSTFSGYRGRSVARGAAMTIQGTVNRAAFLLVLVVLGAAWTWRLFLTSQGTAAVTPWVTGGAIAGLVLALVTVFKKNWAAVTGPLYAAAEGLFLGGLSALMEAQYPGIVLQAVGLTFGTLFGLLMAYKSGLIRATENFKLGVVAATGGIFLVYLATMVLGFFGVHIPYIHQGGWIGIGFSLFVVIVAALNLVLDFDFIERGAQSGAPRYMEWYAAFGLIVTLIWLYIEILRLLAKSRSRR
jgi:uncharacterized YccA/Bax inhibitor family protein